MNWRYRDKLIAAICNGDHLYIRDTGIRVSVDYFGTDIADNSWRGSKSKRSDDPCNIEFVDKPTHKALQKLIKYHIKRNSHSKTMELDGTIHLRELSLTPYESKGAKILYEKKQKSS
jgi:hypothetical protein